MPNLVKETAAKIKPGSPGRFAQAIKALQKTGRGLPE
jgi:hypothetical protein